MFNIPLVLHQTNKSVMTVEERIKVAQESERGEILFSSKFKNPNLIWARSARAEFREQPSHPGGVTAHKGKANALLKVPRNKVS